MRLSLIAAMLIAATSANALETSAGADTVTSSMIGINAKMEAGNAALTSVINKVLECGKQKELFDPMSKSCVQAEVDFSTFGLADKYDIEIYQEAKTVSVPVPGCYKTGKFSDCNVSFNFKNALPEGAQGIQITYGVNKKSSGSSKFNYSWSFNLQSPTGSASGHHDFYNHSGGAGECTDWSAAGGNVSVHAGLWRTGGGAALGGNALIKYYVTKGRLVPKGS